MSSKKLPSHSRSIKPTHIPGGNRQFGFWVFTFVFPLILLGLLEIGIRVVHAGPDLSLFVKEKIGATSFLVMNPDVKGRYFARVTFSPTTSYDYFQMPKPPATFRIFCLGGSTTVGFPYGYAGSFPSFLRQRLVRLFPERRIEIINLGITATNSFTVADIMREIGAYSPDAIIVYDGHNEFYGALGVSSNEAGGRFHWMTSLSLRLLHWRTFVVLRDLYESARSVMKPNDEESSSGTMMEVLARGHEIPYWNAEYQRCLAGFKQNLEDITREGRHLGIPILLGTQASNLRDLPPFVSAVQPDLHAESRLLLHQQINAGIEATLNGDHARALECYLSAAAIDAQYAEAWFRTARAMDSLGRKTDAERAYRHARDLDQLRFRASTDFNDAISSMEDGHGIIVTDIEQAFRAWSPDSLIGSSLILDHLHPTAYGAFLMAKVYAGSMARAGILAPREEWVRRNSVPDSELWDSRTLTPLDEFNAARRIARLTSHWPFTASARTKEQAAEPTILRNIIAQMSEGKLTWERAHVAAAETYEQSGMLHESAREYRTLIDQVPYGVSAYLRLGQIYLREGRIDSASLILQKSLSVEPTYSAAKTVGSIDGAAGRYRDAMRYFDQAAALAGSFEERQEVLQLQAATRRHLR